MSAEPASPTIGSNLYLYDTDSGTNRRDWRALLPAGFRPVVFDGRRWEVEGAADPVASGVIVAHASSFDRLHSEDAEAALAALMSDSLYLVLVAGGVSQGGTGHPRSYRRKQFVGKSDVPDAGFRRCFAEFWTAFRESRKPNFLLLEPLDTHPCADLLTVCAGYALAHAEYDAAGNVTGPGELVPALAQLGLNGLVVGAEGVRDRLAATRDRFASSEGWVEALGGDLARYHALLAIEFSRHDSVAVPGAVTRLLDAIATPCTRVAARLVADAVLSIDS